MEDKRICKTKKLLKNALVVLLSEKPYEKITVIDICKNACVSRITFYKYYSDKSALLDDIFSEMYALAETQYHECQGRNNPNGIPARSFSNLLNSVIDIYYRHFDFFQYTMIEKNPYLAYKYQYLLMYASEALITGLIGEYSLKYPPRQIAAFICSGLIGFINEGHAEDVPIMEVRKNAARIVMSIFRSEIFIS